MKRYEEKRINYLTNNTVGLFLDQRGWEFRYGHRIEYTYDAAGMKRTVKYREANHNMNYSPWDTREPAESDFLSSPLTKNYTGNKVYENGNLKLILTDNGYIEKSGTSYNRYYYLKDRLGNNRVVLNAAETPVQITNYYPSGTTMAEAPARTDQGVQPYKFGGKELDRSKGLDFFDYEWRQFDPTLMRFTTPDPLAEKYYSISPYAYCLNNPVRFIDPDGREVWIYYEDEKGKQQQMLYTANMKYKGKNEFVSASIKTLNSVYNNGGKEVLDVLIGSSNSFNMLNQTPTDKNGNALDALQFNEAAGGGGNIYAGMLMNSQYSDYSKIEGVSHELFHGFQYEKGQGGVSIFNEVEAMVYSSVISSNWAYSTDYMGALSSNGLGNGTASGNLYQQSFRSLVNNGFSKDVFHDAVKSFKAGSNSNASSGYSNYPLVRTPKSYLLKQYHPNHPIK